MCHLNGFPGHAVTSRHQRHLGVNLKVGVGHHCADSTLKHHAKLSIAQATFPVGKRPKHSHRVTRCGVLSLLQEGLLPPTSLAARGLIGARKLLIKKLAAEAKPVDRWAERAGFSFGWKPYLTLGFLMFPTFVQRLLDLLAGHGQGNARLTAGSWQSWHGKLLKHVVLLDRHLVDRASKPFNRVMAGLVREKMRYLEILKANQTHHAIVQA